MLLGAVDDAVDAAALPEATVLAPVLLVLPELDDAPSADLALSQLGSKEETRCMVGGNAAGGALFAFVGWCSL